MKIIFALSAVMLLTAACGKKQPPITVQPMGRILLWDCNTNTLILNATDMKTGKPFNLKMQHNQAFRYDVKAGKYALESIWENKTDIYPLQVKSEGPEEITLEHNNEKGNLSMILKLTGIQWELAEKGENYHYKYGSRHTPNLEVFFMEKHLLKGTKK